jgi:hypothetical protein
LQVIVRVEPASTICSSPLGSSVSTESDGFICWAIDVDKKKKSWNNETDRPLLTRDKSLPTLVRRNFDIFWSRHSLILSIFNQLF